MKIDIKIVLLIVLSIILVFVVAFGCWIHFSKEEADPGTNFQVGKSFDEVSGQFYSVGAGRPISVSDSASIFNIEEVIDSIEEVVDSIEDDKSSDYSTDDDPEDYESSSKKFMNEQYVTMYLVNQKFTNGSGIDIRIDGDCRIYIDGDYAGVISVLRYNTYNALIRYSGGVYGEGRIRVQIDNDRLILIDPLDGTKWYQTR